MTADNTDGALDTTDVYGVEPDTRWLPCTTCNGTGEAYMSRFSPFLGTCRDCNGSGEVAVDE